MQRISTPSASSDHKFLPGDGGTFRGTQLSATWCNNVQEELMSFLEAAGITPSAENQSQVLAAVLLLMHSINDGNPLVVSAPRANDATAVLSHIGIDVNDGVYNLVSVKSDGVNSGFVADKDLGTSEAGSEPIEDVHAQMTLTAQRLSFVRDAVPESGATGFDEKVSVGFDGLLISNRLATAIKVFINKSGAQFNVPSSFSNAVAFGGNVAFGGSVTLSGTTQAADVNVSGKMYANRLQVNIVEKTENYNLYSGAAGDNIPNQKGCRVVIVNVGSGSISVTVNSGGAVIGLGQGGAKEFIVINGSGDWAPIG